MKFKLFALALLAGLTYGTVAVAQAPTNYVDIRGMEYERVGASQTDQVMGATGAAGDYLARLVCDVNTAATSAVSIKDGTDTAINMLENNVGGGVGVYTIELGIKSVIGAWQVTTGAGVTCLGIGRFTD